MPKRNFAVIGHPIGHTMSPFIHQRLFELAKQNGDYTILDISPDELPQKIKILNQLTGYNITIPNKQAIIPYLDTLDKKAALYGSVNTVKNGSVREGFTTDADGFLKALQYGNINFSGNIAIIGCGGAARTFLYEAALAGCQVTLAARDITKADFLAKEAIQKIPNANINTCLISDLNGEFDLLANATPVGMYPHTNSMPVSEKALSKCRNVFDAIYNPLETVLIQKAKANGSIAVGGMSMLVWQAVAAHEIWDNSVYNINDINQLILDSAAEMKKIFY